MRDSDDLTYGVLPLPDVVAEGGLAFLQGIVEGRHPQPPICRTLGFQLTHVSAGKAVFTGTPSADHYNPIGTIHAGFAATLLDSCVACAVHSLVPPGTGYTTMELKVNLVRPITGDTGPVRAEGNIVHMGRRMATAEGRLTDSQGRLLAHASTTCMVLPPDPR
jgi:uncharacterized protein (TIGR00369 family)